jgi:hypothetical protein
MGGGAKSDPRRGLRREPATGALVSDVPIEAIGRPALHVRSPIGEQLFAQFGDAFSHRSRPLTLREIELARPIFGVSIRYELVRIVRTPLFNAPSTFGNTIRIEDPRLFNDMILLHELTHVWQFQTQGTRYESNSLCSQISAAIRTGNAMQHTRSIRHNYTL